MSSEGTVRGQVGHVVGLFVAHGAGAAIESRESVVLIAGVGVEGDRYAEGSGYWSDSRWPDQELTLVDADVADALGVAPGALRRNVAMRGIVVDVLIGRRAAIGQAVIEGVRPCDPCAHIAELNHRPGLLRALVGRGGLRARILKGGLVAVGDAIELRTDGMPTGAETLPQPSVM